MLSIYYFTATWCGPCRAFGPIVSEIQAKYQGRLDLKKIDVDSDPTSTQNYQIRSVPTLVFLKDGVEVFKNSGVMSKTMLESTINQYL